MLRSLFLATAGTLLCAGSSAAQERPRLASPAWTVEGVPGPRTDGRRSPTPAWPRDPRPPLPTARALPAPAGAAPSPGRAFLYSALLPGAAQLALDQWRWPLYLAVEAGGWYGYLHYRGDARDLRAAYRTLAWEVPRQGFADERVDGDFEYYERMARWPASGAFDADADAVGLQPETDPATYNGRVWSLAREIYAVTDVTDPGSDTYGRALDYYRDRAVPPELRWDWAGRIEEQERFGRLIRASDRDFERATTLVGVLLGNHLLSAVDGYVSARLRARGLPETRMRFSPAERRAWTTAWTLRLEIATP